MWNRFLILVQFLPKKNSDLVWNEFGLVRFEKRDLVRIFLLFTTYLVVEQLICSKCYSVTAMLNELCIPGARFSKNLKIFLSFS